MKSSFSDDYKIARVLHIDGQLAAMPNLHRGVDRGVPELRFGSKRKYPDFVVYLPEFQVCFIIECMGKIGDYSYGRSVCEKVENAIISIVNSIACECVVPASKLVYV